MGPEDFRIATDDITSGRVKVVYVTPERFNNEKFRRLISELFFFPNISHIIIDITSLLFLLLIF
jgi:superfamily II DNA helicase RecQ